MRQKVVGCYEMGFEKVRVVLRDGDGGEFYLLPGDIDCPLIKIGVEQDRWSSLVSVLLHEVMELACTRLGCRYSPSDDVSRDHAAYRFVLEHTQLSQACAVSAELLARCLPDLDVAWKKWRKGQK